MDRGANMRAIRSKDMLPELAVRSLAHKLGYRFRLHRKDLPGKPDLVFVSRRKVVFVHGCYWHSHGCRLAHVPKSHQAYWVPKLARNRERDVEHLKALRAEGWGCLVVWECQLREMRRVRQRLSRFLG
jgi:DNA mismatch endonuclease (patch repair protein)